MPTIKPIPERDITPVEPGREADPGEYDRTETFEDMPEGIVEIDIATGKVIREEHVYETPSTEVPTERR